MTQQEAGKMLKILRGAELERRPVVSAAAPTRPGYRKSDAGPQPSLPELSDPSLLKPKNTVCVTSERWAAAISSLLPHAPLIITHSHTVNITLQVVTLMKAPPHQRQEEQHNRGRYVWLRVDWNSSISMQIYSTTVYFCSYKTKGKKNNVLLSDLGFMKLSLWFWTFYSSGFFQVPLIYRNSFVTQIVMPV